MASKARVPVHHCIWRSGFAYLAAPRVATLPPSLRTGFALSTSSLSSFSTSAASASDLQSDSAFLRAAGPTRLLFGQLDEDSALTAALLDSIGGRQRVLLVASIGSFDRHGGYVTYLLQRAGCEVVPFTVPDIRFPQDAVREACAIASRSGCRSVVGVGGGAVLDVSKLVAAACTNRSLAKKQLADFSLEVRGLGGAMTFANPPAPLVAFPTTACTGTEVTASARLSDDDDWVIFCHRDLCPAAAVLDSTLLETVPQRGAVEMGIAAMAQCVEAAMAPTAAPTTAAEGGDAGADYGAGADADAEEGRAEALALALSGIRAAAAALSTCTTTPASSSSSSSSSTEWRDGFARAALLGAVSCSALDRGLPAAVASVLVKWSSAEEDDGSATTDFMDGPRSHAAATAAVLPSFLSALLEKEGEAGFADVAAAIIEGAGLAIPVESEGSDGARAVAWVEDSCKAAGISPLLEQGHGLFGKDTNGVGVARKLSTYNAAWARAIAEVGTDVGGGDSLPALPVGVPRTGSAVFARGWTEGDVAAVVRAAM